MNTIKVKIGLFGDTNVGKTSIFNIINNSSNFSETKSTIGVDFIIKNYTVNNSNIKLLIWDTAGQERYNSIIKPYYNVDIPIYIFDMNNEKSFISLNKWISNVNLYNRNKTIVKYLIGNKSDLETKVSYTKINELVIKYNLQYFVNSNLIKTSINQIMDTIVNNIYQYSLSKVILTPQYIINVNNNTQQEDVIDNCC